MLTYYVINCVSLSHPYMVYSMLSGPFGPTKAPVCHAQDSWAEY